jgi:hypothetical protein
MKVDVEATGTSYENPFPHGNYAGSFSFPCFFVKIGELN